MLDLTIIIPNYNTRQLLRQCISSIYEYTHGVSFEIICIDDNSTDGSSDMVAAVFPDIILIRNQAGLLYAKNNNLGLRLAKARYACLLNSDTKLMSNAFASLVRFMDQHPDAAACGPKLLNPDMTIQSCIRRFAGLGTMVMQGLNWHRFFPNGYVSRKYYASDCDYDKEQIVDSIGTTAFVIRRSTWETAGMLDERLPHFEVDLAYNLMLKRKGYKVYYSPSAEVVHYGGQSINQMARRQIIEHHRALAVFNDAYDYFGKGRLVKSLVRLAVHIRCLIKLAEHRVSRDKRVIKGPGAPRLLEPQHAVRKRYQAGQPGAGKPKLVRMIARLNGSGSARQVCMLHEELVPHFDTRLIIGRLADGEEDMSYLLGSEHNVLRLPQMSREISFMADVRSFWSIWKYLRKERPDIVHTHTAKAGALGRLAAWLARVPVIVHTYHGHVFHGYFSAGKTRVFLAIERFLGKISDKIVAISNSQKQELCRQYRVASCEKTCVVHNGFELERFSRGCRDQARRSLGIGSEDFVAVWAGRMVPVKDLPLLAQLIRRAAEKQSKVSFLVVGDGPEKAEFESMIAGCPNVRLLGWRQDMEHIWSAADVAILTSRNEGTPTTLIEAMAAGLPFVSTHVGGVQDLAVEPLSELPDSIGHQAANGLLVARTPEALLGCIELLAGDTQLRKQMSSIGRAFALEKFSVSRLVEEIRLLYLSELARTRPVDSSAVKRSGNQASPSQEIT